MGKLTPAIAIFFNHHIGILKRPPAHVLGISFKTIYNGINDGVLNLAMPDLPYRGYPSEVSMWW